MEKANAKDQIVKMVRLFRDIQCPCGRKQLEFDIKQELFESFSCTLNEGHRSIWDLTISLQITLKDYNCCIAQVFDNDLSIEYVERQIESMLSDLYRNFFNEMGL